MTESFPHPIINKVDDEPSYKTINEVEKKLITNAASIPSELGGGNHGYLGLVLKPSKYHAITGHQFLPHANPGALPVFPPNPTQPQIAQANATHKNKLRLWREQLTVIKALKNQLTNAFNQDYLEELNDTCAGYNNKSIQDIITYLYENHGDVTPLQLEEAEKAVSEAFDINEPFGSCARRIEDAMDVATAAKCPHAPQQIATKSHDLIVKAQVLPETSLRDWRKKPTADKTWANFKSHFAKETRDFKKEQGITAGNACSVANSANQALPQAQAEFRQLTQTFIDEFKKENNKQHAPEVCPIAPQANSAIANEDLCKFLKELKEEKKELKKQIADKENAPPEPKPKNHTCYYC